jgi:eukaryotic-like serine/threonine-protein kinase
MLSERWRQISRLYGEVLARNVDTRAAFLAQACADDEELRHEIESMLAQQDVLERSFARAVQTQGELPEEPNPSRLSGYRLGIYRLGTLLGRGGMGEVYRARDTKLGREVAIKILPPAFTGHPEHLARFEREARVLAALNHRNIGAIYGIEEASLSPPGGQDAESAALPGQAAVVTALVLELVEGETLSDRIASAGGRNRPSLGMRDALAIAGEIVDALEAAHQKDVVHRDLKPANIMITADTSVKVLDFGLARVAVLGDAGVSSQAPTMSLDGTREGVIIGTPPYMSPEQIRGLRVDKRTDVWAFGCVLYEMLTRRPAFMRATVSDTVVAILDHDPDWAALPADTPMGVRRLLQRCLVKDPDQRLRDIADARFELDDRTPPLPQRGRRGLMLSVATLGVALTAGITGALLWKPRPEPPQVARFVMSLPAGVQLANLGRHAVAISPQGTHIAYGASGTLFVRALDQIEPTAVAGAEGTAGDALSFPRNPFFSPDGQWIGFWQGLQLKKVALRGGPPIPLCDAPNPYGVSWASDDTILYGEGGDGIWRVSASGGTPENVVKVEPGLTAHGPQLLPDGRTIIFTLARGRDWSNADIVAYVPQTRMRKVLLRMGSDARYLPSGHLVFVRMREILVAPFDADNLLVSGEPVSVVNDVADAGELTGAAHFATSVTGSLVYVPASEVSERPLPNRTLVWVDRNGREVSIPAPPRRYFVPRLSPDGTHVALEIRDQQNDIWILDLRRGTLTRLTADAAPDRAPIWSHDGRQLLFASIRSGKVMLYSQRADGVAPAVPMAESLNAGLRPDGLAPTGTSPDGRFVILSVASDPEQRRYIAAVRVGTPSGAERLVETSFNVNNGVISPDGRWLAYESNPSGQDEVFVRPFPDIGAGQWQVSTSGGEKPLWSRDGSELFYMNLDGALMSVSVQTGDVWTAGAQKQLIEAKYFSNSPLRTYDVSADGQRFLMIKPSQESRASDPATMIVVQNWDQELKRLVPIR